ncbi:MAG: carbohydrate kinase family protein [Solobacterium sp.]|nr:carbohydrate kinase family protein [Solobacterium sp.]
MNQKVIVAGHICLDIAPLITSDPVEKVSDLFRPGGLVQVGEARFSTGGAVANTGLAMKYFGADTVLVGRIGNDPFGEIVMNTLNGYKAGEHMIVSKEEPTSYTIILSVPGIDRMFLHAAGADGSFTADDLPVWMMQEASLFHFGYPQALRSMYLDDGAELVRLMRYARDCGTATSLDTAAVDPSSEAGQQNWKTILDNVLPYTDFFVPSVEELCSMIDPERYRQWQKRAEHRDICTVLDTEKDIRPLAEYCIHHGARVVLLKCGAKGMYLRTAEKDTLERISPRICMDTQAWASLSLYEDSYVPERIVSATGCGDTSIAAFLCSVLNGDPPQECLHLAAAAGAACITGTDALSELRPLKILKEMIDAGWEKTGAKKEGNDNACNDE